MERTLILFWCHLVELSLWSWRTVFAISGRDRRRFLGGEGVGVVVCVFFGSRLSLLLSSSSFFFPPFFSWGRLGSCSFLLRVCFAGPLRRRRQVRRATCHVCLLFFCFLSLPGPAPPSPLPPSLFFLSFFLSFSLSLSALFLACTEKP